MIVPLSPEHQRLIETVRENIVCRVHHMPDCSPLLNGCSRVNKSHAALDALALKLARLEKLEAALRDDAVYIATCRALRHGTPTGDACPRCKSDQRELDRVGALLAAREEDAT